jgi:poly(3-hydroxybutyrate) depolymerase
MGGGDTAVLYNRHESCTQENAGPSQGGPRLLQAPARTAVTWDDRSNHGFFPFLAQKTNGAKFRHKKHRLPPRIYGSALVPPLGQAPALRETKAFKQKGAAVTVINRARCAYMAHGGIDRMPIGPGFRLHIRRSSTREISMTRGRLVALSIVGALGAMLTACGAPESGPATGSGGKVGTGGAGTGGATVGTGGATVGTGGATVGTGGATVGTGGRSASTGGSTSTGGATGSGGASGGAVGTGGGATAGSSGRGGAASGGRAAGGSSSTGGMTGSAGAGGILPLKNPPVPSAGCGKAAGVTNGKKMIMSGGMQRSYIIDIPTNYDMNKPYRFFYTSHWIGSNAEAVQGQNYYFLKPLATAANEPAIFLAPQALPGNPNGTWDTGKAIDNVLFDDILAFVKANLCIDTTRVFATGFSFGGMMTYSLSVNHQGTIRAAVGIAPANYNIYVPPKTHQQMAWMQTTGMGDCTCPWVQGGGSCGSNPSKTNGAKFIAIEHATDNGCSMPTEVPNWTSGNHTCFDFKDCKEGLPVKACTFNGPHTNIAMDSGSNTNWIPQESWKFFTQF